MPTPDQLHRLWAAEALGFTAQSGFGSEHADHIPSSTGPLHMEFTGENIGTIHVDPEKKDLKITPHAEAPPQPK